MEDPRDKKVLVVDDSPTIIQVLSYIIRGEGFQLHTAGDGKQVHDAIQRYQPDVILMDLMMPGQGGYDVLRELQTAEHGRIPIIMMSARKPDPSTVQMLEQESNVVGFLSKPVDQEALVLLLHKTLKTDRLPPELQRRTNNK